MLPNVYLITIFLHMNVFYVENWQEVPIQVLRGKVKSFSIKIANIF